MSNPLWISGEIMADIGDDFRLAANEVEAELNARLISEHFGDGFGSLNLIPIVLDETGPPYGEVRRYHKRRRDFEFRLRIPHDAFKQADPTMKRRLIVENVLQAVEEMKGMRVRDVYCDKLDEAIREAAIAKGWLSREQTR
jgi:hypothetical protein